MSARVKDTVLTHHAHDIPRARVCFLAQVLVGTYNESMTSGKSSCEVGKVADFLKDQGF